MKSANPELISSINQRLSQVNTAIETACARVGRSPNEVTMVTVSKRQPIELIRAAYACGLRCFGENYAEEAVAKMDTLVDLADIQWEMVGHIQSRKAKLIASRVVRVHSLERGKLARLLDQFRDPELPPLQVLMEINISGEASKEGVPGDDPARWSEILPLVDEVITYPRLKLTGLMTMPPLQVEMEANRVYFRRLRELQDYINAQRPDLNLHELSMGTSTDFPVAIEEGATIIRLGEAILGPRPTTEEQ
ncbi:MAG TPA: YggS family pyridoxal phosphate-dependent enzyme [Anaerolineaceae bacterium]|nr:YggS family pyridoxal phosphate-dependent enzyme [Anaerolineaceae bacterium]